MRKHITFCFMMVLAVMLALPIYLMAGNLNILTSDNYYIGTNKTYKSFFVDGDGNLSVLMNATKSDLQSSSGIQFEPLINIAAIPGNNSCTVDNGAGIVNGKKDTELKFNVTGFDSSGQTVTVSCLHPGATFLSSGVFTNTYDTVGVYLVVFLASVTETSGTYTTQRTIQINITDPSQQCTLTTQVAGDSAGGSVTPPTSQTVSSGGTAAFTVTINNGYTASVSEGTLNGTTGTVTWTITNITTSHTATITFTQSSSSVTLTTQVAGNSAGGSVTPPTSQTVSSGGTAAFTVTINNGYTASVSEGTLNGTTGTVTWTITNITTSHTATITFTQSGGGGCPGIGTIDSPFCMNVPLNLNVGQYGPNGSGTYQIGGEQKIYFVVDPVGFNIPCSQFFLSAAYYDGSSFNFYRLRRYNDGRPQTNEQPFSGAEFVKDVAPDTFNSTKFIYAVKNNFTHLDTVIIKWAK